jgi:hypothetical protein
MKENGGDNSGEIETQKGTHHSSGGMRNAFEEKPAARALQT